MTAVLDFLGLGKLQAGITLALMIVLAGWGALGWHGKASVSDDRDALVAWAGTACASAGSTLETPKAPRGQACQSAIAALARDRLSVAQQSTQIMVQAEADHAARTTADTATRASGTATLAASAAQMEKTNAEVGTDDRVGGAWFRDLNRAGGLRPPTP